MLETCGCTDNAQERTENGDACCQAHPGRSSRRRWMKTAVFVVVLLAAVALAGHTLLIGQANESADDPSSGSFSVGSSCGGCSKQCSQLSEQSRRECEVLFPISAPKTNAMETTPDKAVVFLLLSGGDVEASRKASHTLDSLTARFTEAGRPVLSLTLREDDMGYDQMIKPFSVTSLPCVITMSQGCQSSVVKTADIAENVLCTAFIKAVGDCGTDSTGQSVPCAAPRP